MERANESLMIVNVKCYVCENIAFKYINIWYLSMFIDIHLVNPWVTHGIF